MRGEFNLQVRDAGGLRDEDFIAARKEGCLEALLKGLSIDQEMQVRNKINDQMARGILKVVFAHGFAGGFPFDSATVLLMHIVLTTYTSEIDYDSYWTYYGSINTATGSANTSSGGRAFIRDDIGDKHWSDTSGKEELYFRSRFLWLPSQGNSNNIRAIDIYGGETVDYNSNDKFVVGRVLLKDKDTGNPVVVVKNINQVLTLEYTYSLISI